MKVENFIRNNPELTNQVRKCNTQEEFLKFVKDNNISFEDMSLEKAFNFLCKTNELDEDSLKSIAGGKQVQGTGLAPITEEEARKKAKKGEHIVQLNAGYYRVNGKSIQYFDKGFYEIT